MTVKVDWYNAERTIMIYTFVGRWTWEEFYPVFDKMLRDMDTVSHKIDFIMDMLQSEYIPFGAIFHLKRAADTRHPNLGMVIYVGMNPLLQSIGQVFLKVYPKSAAKYPFDFAISIEEARAKLLERRAVTINNKNV